MGPPFAEEVLFTCLKGWETASTASAAASKDQGSQEPIRPGGGLEKPPSPKCLEYFKNWHLGYFSSTGFKVQEYPCANCFFVFAFLQNTLVLLPLCRCKIGFSSFQRIFLNNSHPASLLLNTRQPALTVRWSKTQTRASYTHFSSLHTVLASHYSTSRCNSTSNCCLFRGNVVGQRRGWKSHPLPPPLKLSGIQNKLLGMQSKQICLRENGLQGTALKATLPHPHLSASTHNHSSFSGWI